MRKWFAIAGLVAFVLALITLARMVMRLDALLGLVALSATVALLTAPIRRAVGRRIGFGGATGLTAVLSFAAAVALAALVFHDLQGQTDHLSTMLTERIDRLDPDSTAGRIADALDAHDSVARALDELPPRIVAGEHDALGVGRQTLDVLLVVILAAFFQSSAGATVDWVAARWPRERRAEVRDLLDDLDRRGVGYARRALLLAAVVAVVTGLVAKWCGLSGPALIGTWIGAWSLVPGVGWLLALVPLVVAAVVAPSAGLAITAITATVASLAVMWVRRTRVEPGRARPGVGLSALAVAVGIGAAGFGGMLLSIFAVSVVAAAATTARRLPPLPPALWPAGVAVAPPGEGSTRETWPGALTWRSALTVVSAVVAGVIGWMQLQHLSQSIVWIVVSGMIAVALNRPVRFLEGRRVPRPAAVAAVLVLGLGAIVGAGLAGVRGASATSTQLRDELPGVVTDLYDAPIVGHWLEQRDASTWVGDQVQDLPARLEGGGSLGDYLPAAGAWMLDLLWVALLTIALLLDGPRLVAAVESRVPAARRRQFSRLVDVAHGAIGGYLAGAALVAAMNATFVLLVALALGIALAPVLAMWAFLWNFVPQVGGFMGGFPLVVVALSVGPVQAAAAAALFVSYQFLENHLIQPAIISHAIDVPPWATLLAALSGGAAAGVLGAVILTPLVGVVRVIVRDVHRTDFPGRTAEATRARPVPPDL